ncbi:MAG TPA: Ig-like domain-containing protein, partial [Verrucomicrobiae bacterium]|nr:Ig-like domain-containing protein [Verrucomicrobiae bacterium]
MENRIFARAVALASLLTLVSPARAIDTSDFFVVKTQVFNQTSDAAPVAVATGAFTARASAPGFGGPSGFAGVSSVKVTFPGGASQNLPYVEDDDVFAKGATNNTAAGLNAIFPAGAYAFALNSSVLGNLTGTVTLPADQYPAAPQVSNFSAAQALDVSQDFDLTFKPVAGITGDTEFEYVIMDGANQVYSDSLSSGNLTSRIDSGALDGGKTYQGIVRLGTPVSVIGFPSTAYEFVSETHFTIVTKKGTGGGGNPGTLPVLTGTVPEDGALDVPATQFVTFTFNEPMDTNRIGLTWTGVDSTKWSYFFTPDGTLACLYQGQGGLPSTTVTWTLNAVAGAPNNFRDLNGHELPTYHGSFTVKAGGGTGGTGDTCDGATPVESAGFGIFKQVNYLQNSAAAPVADTVNGAMLFAFSSIPNSPGRAAIEYNHKLDFFGQIFNYEFLTNGFPTRAELDAAYPAGAYNFQLRDRNAPTTVIAQVALTFTANGYPPVPHFGNYAAAQAIPANSAFTLTWDPFTGATTNTDALQLEILDADGSPIFMA